MRAPRAASTLAILAALALGNLVNTHLREGELEPVPKAGSLDQVTHLTYGDVEVTDVRPAVYLSPQLSDELARRAGGVYVIVSVKVTATREPTYFLAAYLQDSDGRHYRTSDKAGCAQNVESGTGVPAYALFCFDVPPDRLAGMHFELSRGNLIYGTLAGDHLADVDLEISAADEESWRDTEGSYRVETTSREPIDLKTVTIEQDQS